MSKGDSLLYGRDASEKLIVASEYFTANEMGSEAVHGELDITFTGAFFRINEDLPAGITLP